jgi:hypothetical protein
MDASVAGGTQVYRQPSMSFNEYFDSLRLLKSEKEFLQTAICHPIAHLSRSTKVIRLRRATSGSCSIKAPEISLGRCIL